MTRLEVLRADITTLAVDAIVNAANEGLLGGGGVDGAIHRAAGPRLMEDCRRIGHCPTGAARITPGHDLPAKWVIHAVGPVWHGGAAGEGRLLASAYEAALALAAERGMRSIAFSAISTGVYGFPAGEAARIAVSTVRRFLARKTHRLEHVIFCCFNAECERAHMAALAGPAGGEGGREGAEKAHGTDRHHGGLEGDRS